MKKLLSPLLIIVFIIGCGSGGERASVVMVIQASMPDDSVTVNASLDGYGFKTVPVATVNQETLWIEWSGFDICCNGPITSVNVGDECEFHIDYGDGEGGATESMPAEFAITSPDTSDILNISDDLHVTWESATGADWYWLDMYLSYCYIDTVGLFDYFNFRLDTILDDTSCTVTANRLFPGDVDSIITYNPYCYVNVQAVSGPKIVPGEEGNITGDAVGFFWCVWTEDVHFFVEPSVTPAQENSVYEISERHLEAMRRFASENE